jgi:hypothetical protein
MYAIVNPLLLSPDSLSTGPLLNIITFEDHLDRMTIMIITTTTTTTGARGSVVVKTLCYKPEGRVYKIQ